MPKGKPCTAEFRAKVTPEALQGARAVNETAASYELDPNPVRDREARAEPGLSRVFSAAEDDRARERAMRVVDEARPETPRAGARKARAARPTCRAAASPGPWGDEREARLPQAGPLQAPKAAPEHPRLLKNKQVLNSDRGSVSSSAAYEGPLESEHVRRSMDGKARRAGDVIVERRFRSLETERPRIGGRSTPAEPRRLVAGYVEQHDNARRRQSLGYETPSSWYHSGLAAAA